MAGTMTDKAVDGGSKEDPPYPGESPTDAEFDEWLKKFQNVLRGTDYAAMLADETPASLIGFSVSVDTSDLHEQMALAGELDCAVVGVGMTGCVFTCRLARRLAVVNGAARQEHAATHTCPGGRLEKAHGRDVVAPPETGNVASFAAYLCSDGAKRITMEDITIAGGALW